MQGSASHISAHFADRIAAAPENRLAYVDALRGLASLGVIAVHVGQRCEPCGMLRFLSRSGAYGVQLFFVISAFTLFMSFHTRAARGQRTSYLTFMLRRFFRIAPLFYVAMVFYLTTDGFGARAWRGPQEHITPANIVATASFMNGWNPYWINSIVPGGWSIAVEMPFYLMVPLLYVTVRNLRQAILFVVASLIVSACLTEMLTPRHDMAPSDIWNSFLYFWLPHQLPVFGLGIVLFFLVEELDKISRSTTHQATWLGPPLLGTALCVFAAAYRWGSPATLVPKHFACSIGFAICALGLHVFPMGVIVNRFTCYIGRISYSMYLCHFAIVQPMSQLVWNSAGGFDAGDNLYFVCSFLLTVILTSCVASATFFLIEEKGQRFGRAVIRRFELPTK